MFEKQTSEQKKTNGDRKTTVAKHHSIPQKINKQRKKQTNKETNKSVTKQKSKSKNQKVKTINKKQNPQKKRIKQEWEGEIKWKKYKPARQQNYLATAITVKTVCNNLSKATKRPEHKTNM